MEHILEIFLPLGIFLILGVAITIFSSVEDALLERWKTIYFSFDSF